MYTHTHTYAFTRYCMDMCKSLTHTHTHTRVLTHTYTHTHTLTRRIQFHSLMQHMAIGTADRRSLLPPEGDGWQYCAGDNDILSPGRMAVVLHRREFVQKFEVLKGEFAWSESGMTSAFGCGELASTRCVCVCVTQLVYDNTKKYSFVLCCQVHHSLAHTQHHVIGVRQYKEVFIRIVLSSSSLTHTCRCVHNDVVQWSLMVTHSSLLTCKHPTVHDSSHTNTQPRSLASSRQGCGHLQLTHVCQHVLERQSQPSCSALLASRDSLPAMKNWTPTVQCQRPQKHTDVNDTTLQTRVVRPHFNNEKPPAKGPPTQHLQQRNQTSIVQCRHQHAMVIRMMREGCFSELSNQSYHAINNPHSAVSISMTGVCFFHHCRPNCGS